MKTLDYKSLAEVISFYTFPTYDAKFEKQNGKQHYKKRMRRKDYPDTMSENDYFKLAEKVSTRNLNGKTVRAYKLPNGRTVKCDGKNIVIYYGGKYGTVITMYNASMSRWKQLFERDKKAYKGTKEIFTE